MHTTKRIRRILDKKSYLTFSIRTKNVVNYLPISIIIIEYDLLLCHSLETSWIVVIDNNQQSQHFIKIIKIFLT